MTNYLQALDLSLSAESDTAKLRNQVLEETPWAPSPTTNVSYVAANRLLIIADKVTAQDIESRLPDKILCYIAIPADKSGSPAFANGYYCADLTVSGYLGKFTVTIDSSDDNDNEYNNLASIFNIQTGVFDQVLDCSGNPYISAAIKPPGYHFVPKGVGDFDSQIESIPNMIGEFEKPKYFDYNAGICAHGRSGISGCTRCLDACPTDAIISIGESIEVNPHLCQGGGICASNCPTGAITYSYPKATEQMEFIRILLKSFREKNNNHNISMLIFDHENSKDLVAQSASRLPDEFIPFAVEEIGSVGLDLLASAMAYGANKVYLLVPDSLPSEVQSGLQSNCNIINTVLDQTNCSTHAISIISDLEPVFETGEKVVIDKAATYAPLGNKRSIIRSALSFFSEIATEQVDEIDLPKGSLFGQTLLDQDACTLCMGCVSVCPGGALQAGGDSPALKFIEANCVQCGICTRACPESAMTLDARIHFDVNVVNTVRTLKDEPAFHCIDCGKPFATLAMIGKITEKLQGHWMFDKPDAIRRLKMCEDCRVKDMFDKNDMIS